MNMKNILTSLGLGDGSGDVSSGRIAFILIVIAVIIPKVVIAIKTMTPPQWNEQDLMILGAAFGGKLVQNHQENKALEIKPAEPVKTP